MASMAVYPACHQDDLSYQYQNVSSKHGAMIINIPSIMNSVVADIDRRAYMLPFWFTNWEATRASRGERHSIWKKMSDCARVICFFHVDLPRACHLRKDHRMCSLQGMCHVARNWMNAKQPRHHLQRSIVRLLVLLKHTLCLPLLYFEWCSRLLVLIRNLKDSWYLPSLPNSRLHIKLECNSITNFIPVKRCRIKPDSFVTKLSFKVTMLVANGWLHGEVVYCIIGQHDL